MSKADLHTHTTASDGSLTPTELVNLAHERDIGVLGITDHDTTAGLAEAHRAAEAMGLVVVPGVELNGDLEGGHADILGYGFDPDSDALQGLLSKIRSAREGRAKTMVEKLQALGAEIDYEMVRNVAGDGSVGRPHVAQALVAAGFVPNVGAAFDRYIGQHGPAYAERYRLTPAEACTAVRDAGGVPSLAHPVPPEDPKSDPLGLRRFLPGLIDAGLGAMECRYPGYGPQVTTWLETLADHFGLIPTGGSDFHGPWRKDRELGSVDVPKAHVERLLQAAGAESVPSG